MKNRIFIGISYCGKTYGVKERLIGIAFGMAMGFLVSYIIYSNLIIEIISALIGGALLKNIYINMLIRKRKEEFVLQFCDFLDSISTSFSCGNNTFEAFATANRDVNDLFSKDSPICMESLKLIEGLENGRTIDELLKELASDCKTDDVKTFSEIYSICNQAGGNLKTVVNESREIIVEKTEIEGEIRALLSGPKNELNIMSVMPFVIMISFRVFNVGVVENTASSMIVNTVALGIFIFSYLLGRRIVNIKV